MALTPLVPAIPMARSLAKAASNGDNDEVDLLVLVGGNDADVDVGEDDVEDDDDAQKQIVRLKGTVPSSPRISDFSWGASAYHAATSP